MHTTIIIFFGLVLLALMLYIGERVGFNRQTLTYSFVVLAGIDDNQRRGGRGHCQPTRQFRTGGRQRGVWRAGGGVGSVHGVEQSLGATDVQSTNQVQELHVPFVLIEDVVNDLILGVTHQIVVLTAFGQMHFGPVVATVVELLGPHPATGKGRREVTAHLHLVDEWVLLAMTDFQADTVIRRIRLSDHVQTLLDKHRRHFFNRRAHRRFEEAVNLIPRREMHRLTQALTPTATL